MNGNKVRELYIGLFKSKGHEETKSAPLVPENDPTTLFVGSGMQPMINYFLGEPHPMGKRITNSQKCFRAEDIEEVGDNRHTTAFEMLGNWSFGDYWKKDQLDWSFEFFTKIVGLDPDKLYVSVFAGNKHIPQDQESIELWQQIFDSNTPAKNGESGFDKSTKIYLYDETKNWWSRSGVPQNMPTNEPGGTTSEIFYDFGKQYDFHAQSIYKQQPCHINCDCGRFLEIGNSVFMEYKKTQKGNFTKLPEKNIDFGGGLERIVAAKNNNPDVFTTDLFIPIIDTISKEVGQPYEGENQVHMRVIADHLRAATLLIKDGVFPSNKAQGYFLRRLIRRSVVKLHQLGGGLDAVNLTKIAAAAIEIYQGIYFDPDTDRQAIFEVLDSEGKKFSRSLERGLKQIDKVSPFDLYQSYGFPIEITEEIYAQQEMKLDRADFDRQLKEHQDKSRTASAGMFKGGLADHSETIIKYHTTTHLLHQALKDVLGDHVQQQGSNITDKRLRFDFKHDSKLTDDQKIKVIDLINQKIAANLPVTKTIMPKSEALDSGAVANFRETYPDKVNVYTIGLDPDTDWYSKELCGGPHVSSTGDIGVVTIKKEGSVGAGVRRIYLALVTS